jgi:hypothetical protein
MTEMLARSSPLSLVDAQNNSRVVGVYHTQHSTSPHQGIKNNPEHNFLVDRPSFLRYVSNRDQSIDWLNLYQVR